MICHHYKCVFIHIPKTGGQSIEHVFLKLLHLDWNSRAPLLLRYNDRPELGPPRLAHLKASEYVRCRYLTPAQFTHYFKFCVVRDPWDRVVSTYKYLGWDRYVEFKKFVVKTLTTQLLRKNYWFIAPQTDFVCDDNGHLLVDFVGRFENLRSDFEQIRDRLELPVTELPHVNRSEEERLEAGVNPKQLLKHIQWLYKKRAIPSFRRLPSFSNYRDYYDDESREIVAQLYRRDLELFGYQFD